MYNENKLQKVVAPWLQPGVTLPCCPMDIHGDLLEDIPTRIGLTP